MQLQFSSSDSELTVRLDGEIDHHSSIRLRSEIDAAIYAHLPHTLILDFSRVSFMDSSGIGLIMGRYRILQPLGSSIVLLDPAPHISRVLRLAGMERLASIRTSAQKEVI
ncbi:MAG: anti-sigma factor antagonist [Oscillospiraceae bacterium]|nr:anti-sigma factor antagonist [Oscillospiraceae bacterium]